LRSTLIRFLQTELATWPIAPIHASVFGSFARHDGDTASDIDVLVVRGDRVAADDPVWERSLSDARGKVRTVIGNPLSIVELSVSELRAALSAEEPIATAWRADAVHLIGQQYETLARSLR